MRFLTTILFAASIALGLGSTAQAAGRPSAAECNALKAVHITCDFSGSAGPHEPNSSSIDAKGKVHVYGADGFETWYDRGVKPASLKAAIALDMSFHGAGNAGWHMPGSGNVCQALHKVGFACDYNTRCALTMFLTMNGKGLFPAEGGTNPWYTSKERADEIKLGTTTPDDSFIGQPRQNEMLAAAVLRNAHLFHHGDLTASDVRTKWR